MPGTSKPGQKPGERMRDEARNDHSPKFASGEWELADEREPDERFGKSRADGGPLSVSDADDDAPVATYEETEETASADEGVLETSAHPQGMGQRGEPHKAPRREKPNPKPSTKTKQKASTRPKAKQSRH